MQVNVYARLDTFKVRQVFKAWFNQIDILKRWRFLNDNTEAWYIRKHLRRVMKAWRKEIKMKNLYFKVFDKHIDTLKKFTLLRMMASVNSLRAFRYVKKAHDQHIKMIHIRQWYLLLGTVHLSRFGFKKKKYKRCLRNHFNALDQYRLKKIRFRDGMKKLLKMRARNLMKIAFVRGLKPIWH